MLQIRNTGNGKSEWNIGETHLIIPMIDGDLMSNKERDKILTSAITLNTLEGSEQAILTNALEHSLVVGLDKNLFETTNYKSDLLIIQNSDLKLLHCNTDIKVAHTSSDVEQDKNEILWQNPILKNRISGSEKTIFEIRQVLNYDNIDLEKNTKQINLGTTSGGKPSKLVEADKETMSQENNIPDSSFVISFDSETDKSKSICISLNSEVPKTYENINSAEKKKLFQGDVHSDMNNMGPYKLEENNQESVFNATSQMASYSDSLPDDLVNCSKEEIDRKDKIMSRKVQTIEDSEAEGNKCSDGINDFFWEKNLPLKKKAKMKRTLMAVSLENQKGLLKGDAGAYEQERVLTRRNTKQATARAQKKQEPENNDSEMVKNRSRKPKKLKLKTESPLQDDVREDLKKADSSFGEDEMTAIKNESYEFGETKFNDIHELIECLLKCQMINTTVWQTLNSGLKEMKVDILKEMLLKRKENCSPESSNYSPQLKAFALVLYFKQPAAFNHLSQVFKSGWPSLKVIKEWKRRMNTRRRR